MGALEQNFNPSKDDVERRTLLGEWYSFICFCRGGRGVYTRILIHDHTHTVCVCCGAGYPQLLSGHMTMPGQVAKSHQTVLFPEASITTPWTKVNQAKRYQLIFPFYPFRTLCPRELAQTKLSPSSFDGSSPLFPAHTQLNITMKRRPAAQLLNYMLPENLDTSCGNAVGTLTEAERNTAVQYTFKEENVQDDAEVQITRHFRVLSVNILLKEVYLQVTTTKGDSSTHKGGGWGWGWWGAAVTTTLSFLFLFS